MTGWVLSLQKASHCSPLAVTSRSYCMHGIAARPPAAMSGLCTGFLPGTVESYLYACVYSISRMIPLQSFGSHLQVILHAWRCACSHARVLLRSLSGTAAPSLCAVRGYVMHGIKYSTQALARHFRFAETCLCAMTGLTVHGS